jgi:hypothetical protein
MLKKAIRRVISHLDTFHAPGVEDIIYKLDIKCPNIDKDNSYELKKCHNCAYVFTALDRKERWDTHKLSFSKGVFFGAIFLQYYL